MSLGRVPTSLALGFLLLGGLTACGGTDTNEPEATAESTATSSPDSVSSGDATAWAGAVCSAADDVESSLDALGTSLQVDLGSGTNLADQVVPQIESQVSVVGDSVSQLATAVAAVPADADPELSEAAADLDADRQALQASVDDLRAAADEVTAASGGAAVVEGVRGVAAQLALVRLDAVTFADSLRTTAEQGSTAVRAAFVDAPECDRRL
jgi:hypothetical protein